MNNKHIATVQDLTTKEIRQIFKLAKKLKEEQKKNKPHKLLEGKSLAMLFQKPSTRTRVSFEVAMTQLGGHALCLAASDLQLGRGETIADTARVLSGYANGIMARVYSHKDITELADNSQIPVINGLSDEFHPCQALTDLFTIWETRGNLNNLTVSFIGDGDNNVTNSLLLLCAKLGVNFRIGCPKKYEVKKRIIELAKKDIKKNKTKVEIFHDAKNAARKTDVIYADVWTSMGKSEEKERIKTLTPFQINKKLLSYAKREVLVMHCLPAHREQEITSEVMDGPNSIIFRQAENRLHLQKAILASFL